MGEEGRRTDIVRDALRIRQQQGPLIDSLKQLLNRRDAEPAESAFGGGSSDVAAVAGSHRRFSFGSEVDSDSRYPTATPSWPSAESSAQFRGLPGANSGSSFRPPRISSQRDSFASQDGRRLSSEGRSHRDSAITFASASMGGPRGSWGRRRISASSSEDSQRQAGQFLDPDDLYPDPALSVGSGTPRRRSARGSGEDYGSIAGNAAGAVDAGSPSEVRDSAQQHVHGSLRETLQSGGPAVIGGRASSAAARTGAIALGSLGHSGGLQAFPQWSAWSYSAMFDDGRSRTASTHSGPWEDAAPPSPTSSGSTRPPRLRWGEEMANCDPGRDDGEVQSDNDSQDGVDSTAVDDEQLTGGASHESVGVPNISDPTQYEEPAAENLSESLGRISDDRNDTLEHASREDFVTLQDEFGREESTSLERTSRAERLREPDQDERTSLERPAHVADCGEHLSPEHPAFDARRREADRDDHILRERAAYAEQQGDVDRDERTSPARPVHTRDPQASEGASISREASMHSPSEECLDTEPPQDLFAQADDVSVDHQSLASRQEKSEHVDCNEHVLVEPPADPREQLDRTTPRAHASLVHAHDVQGIVDSPVRSRNFENAAHSPLVNLEHRPPHHHDRDDRKEFSNEVPNIRDGPVENIAHTPTRNRQAHGVVPSPVGRIDQTRSNHDRGYHAEILEEISNIRDRAVNASARHRQALDPVYSSSGHINQTHPHNDLDDRAESLEQAAFIGSSPDQNDIHSPARNRPVQSVRSPASHANQTPSDHGIVVQQESSLRQSNAHQAVLDKYSSSQAFDEPRMAPVEDASFSSVYTARSQLERREQSVDACAARVHGDAQCQTENEMDVLADGADVSQLQALEERLAIVAAKRRAISEESSQFEARCHAAAAEAQMCVEEIREAVHIVQLAVDGNTDTGSDDNESRGHEEQREALLMRLHAALESTACIDEHEANAELSALAADIDAARQEVSLQQEELWRQRARTERAEAEVAAQENVASQLATAVDHLRAWLSGPAAPPYMEGLVRRQIDGSAETLLERHDVRQQQQLMAKPYALPQSVAHVAADKIDASPLASPSASTAVTAAARALAARASGDPGLAAELRALEADCIALSGLRLQWKSTFQTAVAPAASFDAPSRGRPEMVPGLVLPP
eukprot:TRINITY_DN11815_c0_g4_i1.p1 TRINITY_DN11815_c0_g4~~TRINITY_DN11815_c0_g4_i1.p1  ORF type:complete len:1157 (-),score=167.12 TRINITY_DN11815_c0_g4_i1:438-3908(-)